jgi:VWFA-related protein
MSVPRLVCASLITAFCAGCCLPAQQPAPSPSSQSIHLDVVVDTKSGQPVTQLGEKNFTVFDNKTARPITHFKVEGATSEPVSVIVLIDAVDTPYHTVAYAREGIEKFFKANEGQLANPTSLAVLTDEGVQFDSKFSTDGNAMSDALEHRQIGLREINRTSEWGAQERFQICMNAIGQLLAFAATIPGKKIVLWVSPGWPIISGPRVYLDTHQENQIFNNIVSLSTEFRQMNLTLYNINPVGVAESLQRADYYEAFLKGVAKPNQVQIGNLAIQVLAIQSGGLAIESNSDVTGMMMQCLQDAKSWYAISFDPLPADKPDEYRHIEVKVDQPGMVVRTRDGYYANPVALPVK